MFSKSLRTLHIAGFASNNQLTNNPFIKANKLSNKYVIKQSAANRVCKRDKKLNGTVIGISEKEKLFCFLRSPVKFNKKISSLALSVFLVIFGLCVDYSTSKATTHLF